MKRLLPILLLVFSVGVGAETIDDLVNRDGLYYKKFTDVPFTGNIKSKLHKGKITNGKKDGPWVSYHRNGQLFVKGTYRNGKAEGPWIEYHANGQLFKKGTYKDDRAEGAWVKYRGNGDLRFKGTYKDGWKHGQGTQVIYVGDKSFKYVGEFEGGKKHGRGTYTNHNGDTYVGEFKDHKRWTGTYYGKDGKAIATWSDGVEKPVK